jgi:hypothetical protein
MLVALPALEIVITPAQDAVAETVVWWRDSPLLVLHAVCA